MRIIYEPRGRALEYAPLAVSLYRGCSHGCTYCFVPESTRTEPTMFLQPYPRKNALSLLKKDCEELQRAGDKREILMSFTCDPYNPLEKELRITRSAIRILIKHGLNFTILTKGNGFEDDLSLVLNHKDHFRYGVSLTFDNYTDTNLWEPNTLWPGYRIESLKDAHTWGIRTWVSLEPVVYPEQTLDLIRQTVGFVDEYRIGKFNHTKDNPELQRFIDSIGYKYPTDQEWREFVQAAKALLDETGSRYIFKKDLQPYLQEVRP